MSRNISSKAHVLITSNFVAKNTKISKKFPSKSNTSVHCRTPFFSVCIKSIEKKIYQIFSTINVQIFSYINCNGFCNRSCKKFFFSESHLFRFIMTACNQEFSNVTIKKKLFLSSKREEFHIKSYRTYRECKSPSFHSPHHEIISKQLHNSLNAREWERKKKMIWQLITPQRYNVKNYVFFTTKAVKCNTSRYNYNLLIKFMLMRIFAFLLKPELSREVAETREFSSGNCSEKFSLFFLHFFFSSAVLLDIFKDPHVFLSFCCF